jgi:hypothetical protein
MSTDHRPEEVDHLFLLKNATSIHAVLWLLAGIAIAWMTHREARAAQLLAKASLPGQAEIVRHFLAPNGITPRLEYKITTEAGISGTRNAELARDYWDSLEDATSVAVVYVPGEPWISRLVEGEVEETDFTRTPLGGYGLGAAAMVMGLFFLGASVLQWRGWDIDLDSKTGKFSIKQFGTGR